MRIARDGAWFYRGSPIGRLPLVKLFASVLRREADGSYWLVTPAERGRIEVEDVPFLAVELTVAGEGRGQQLIFRTNLDDIVTAGPDHPLRVETAASGEPAPYIHGARRARGEAGAAGLLRAGRTWRRGAGRRRAPIRGLEQRRFFPAGRPGAGLAMTVELVGAERRDRGADRRCENAGRAGETPSRDWVIARFARLGQPGRRGFGGTADPAEAAALRRATRGDHDLNPGMTPPSTALRPAAVLVPLIDRAEGMSVLLTLRTAHLSAHAGQIAFPGGRIEAGDRDATAAALRETEEEIGLPPRPCDPDRPARHLCDRNRVRDHPDRRHRRPALPACS